MVYLRAIAIGLIALMVIMNIPLNQVHAQNEVIFPTIYYTTYQGYNVTITDLDWYNIVYPVIYSSNFSTYDWKKSPLKNYILFDYSLTGLNPYGAEFILALQSIGNLTQANVTKAFQAIANLDATGDGYTNQEKLNAGALPGFYNSTPTSFNDPAVRATYGYVFTALVVVSVFILYFVFNRKKEGNE